MDLNLGDRISFKYRGEKLEGSIVNDREKYTVKLNSGYNMIVEPSEMKDVKKEKIEAKKTGKKKSSPPKNRDLPNVALLHTGGTIASKVDYETGAVIAKFNAGDILQLVPELSELSNIYAEQISNVQSESIRPAHYNKIAEAVKKKVEDSKTEFEGIIISHGTDTLHYTSAVLSFMLKNLPIPVVLVGSQRSSDRGSSDSASNLVSAVNFINSFEGGGVFICMHKTISDDACEILEGVNARKIHTSRRDAFKPVNKEIFAEVSYPEGEVEINKENYQNKDKDVNNPDNRPGRFSMNKLDDSLSIGVLKTHPCTSPEDISHFKNHDALIVEGTGLGHAPTESFDEVSKINEKNFKELEKLSKSMPVVMTSQTVFGRVNMNVYSPQKKLQEIGVLSGGSMITETVFGKLLYLLSNYSVKDSKDLLKKDLRGELSKRIEYEEEYV